MNIYEIAFIVAIALNIIGASGVIIGLWLILSKRYELYQERHQKFIEKENRIREEMKKRRKSFDV